MKMLRRGVFEKFLRMYQHFCYTQFVILETFLSQNTTTGSIFGTLTLRVCRQILKNEFYDICHTAQKKQIS